VIVRIMTYERSTLVNDEKYIGLDVHQATISVAVMDASGKVVMESILETKAATLLEFFAGLRGTLWVTFEEGTWSVWLYDLLHARVDKLVVCNPRKNALLKDGNKSDRIDARKLAELLRGNQLKPVYHGETGVRMLRELSRSYLTIVKDLSRVMNRLKAVYRSWAIPCAGRDVYYRRHRAQWLSKIREAGVRRRAERLYEQLDMLQHLRQQARRELLAERTQACHHRPAAPDSLHGADSLGAGRGADADSPSFSHQATTLVVQRIGLGDPHQRGLPLCRRPTATLQETGLYSRIEQGSQS
jgi:transposase